MLIVQIQLLEIWPRRNPTTESARNCF